MRDELNREKLTLLGSKLRPPIQEEEFTQGVIFKVHEFLRQRNQYRPWLFRPLITPFQLAAALTAVVLLLVPLLWLFNGQWLNQEQPPNEKIVTRSVIFSYKSYKPVQVELVGDFNNWRRGVHFLRSDGKGNYTLELMLPPGRYQYQFVVDGVLWQKDLLCSETVEDGFGNENSLLVL